MLDEHLGPYELIEELGLGGMATVYRAYQRTMDRHVAIKVIHHTLASDATWLERFQREARLIARLEHPHILPVYDFDGRHRPPYIVMRYVSGGTLREVIQRARLALPDLTRLLEQIAAALDYAHRQGIIHRDVKPSNIIFDADGNAFLSDFGVARFTTEATLTASGVAVGTPTYMSPEQVEGRSDVGPAADIYALGLVAFELLTGQPPFTGDNPLALMFQHLHDAPPPARALNSALPAAVDDVFDSVLAKLPERRFATATRFVEVLTDVLNLSTPRSLSALPTAALPTRSLVPHILGDVSLTLEQNKVVTAMSANASEYAEALSIQRGSEAARLALNTWWSRARAIIVDHHGSILEQGDNDLLAVWGGLATHEDDAVSAVHTALELQNLLRELNAGAFVESDEEPLPLKIGLSTGTVLLTPGDRPSLYTATGLPVTLARRLSEQATGLVLITHETFREVYGVFDLLSDDRLKVRGRKVPVPTYRVVAAKARAFQLRTHGVEGVETKLIGRRADMEVLQKAFLNAVEDHETQVITLVGATGLGKSRLLDEFDKWAELRPERFRRMRCTATSALRLRPYALWREVLAWRCNIFDDDSPDVACDKMERGIAELTGQADLEAAHLLGQLIGLDFSRSHYVRGLIADPTQLIRRSRQLLVRLFERASRLQPIVLLLNDVQHADEASLDLLMELITAQPTLPLLVVCTARPDLLDRRPTWGQGVIGHTRVDLRPLDKRDSRDLAQEILQKAPEVPKSLRDLLVARAEGNPLFMEELVKMLIDDRVIIRDRRDGQDVWHIAADRVEQLRVPPTLAGLLQARFDALLYTEKLILQRASVIGRVFFDAALQALDAVDETSVPDAPAVLQQLVEREFIYQRETTRFAGSVEYVFAQTLVRDQIYDTLVSRQLQAYHTALAQWLAAPERADDYLPLIAEHYERAGDADRAATYLTRAGEQAVQRSAHREALVFFDRARQLAAPSLLLLLWSGEAKQHQGEFEGAQADWQAALALAREADDQLFIARILFRLSLRASARGDLPAMQRYLDECLPLARAVDDQTTLAEALYGRGNMLWRQGRFGEAEESLREALPLARALGNRILELYVMSRLGSLLISRRQIAAGRALYEEACDLARRINNPERLASALNNLGEIDRMEGRFADARERYREALHLQREVGNPSAESIALLNLGWIALELNDHPEAESIFSEVLRRSTRMQAWPQTLEAAIGVADLRARQDELSKALVWLGAVQQHPSFDAQHGEVIAPILDRLRQTVSAAEVEAGLARGRELKLKTLIEQLLTATSVRYNDH
jgi:serine/threonine protein kinase/tetratricopeptide (TPR) repeat protein